MPRERTSVFGVVVLLACEVAIIRVLPALGSLPPDAMSATSLRRWLEMAPIEAVMGTIVWAMAVLAAWWLLASTVAYLAASAARWRPGADWLGRVTAGPIRRMVNGACAIAVVSSVVVGSGPASADGQRRGPGVEQPYTPTPAGDVYPTPPPAAAATATTYIVRPGDNFWRLAQRRITTDATSADVGTVRSYWVRLVDANRSRIRSGDPNLIYPGEVLEHPAIGDREPQEER